jgi:hypothetical protein
MMYCSHACKNINPVYSSLQTAALSMYSWWGHARTRQLRTRSALWTAPALIAWNHRFVRPRMSQTLLSQRSDSGTSLADVYSRLSGSRCVSELLQGRVSTCRRCDATIRQSASMNQACNTGSLSTNNSATCGLPSALVRLSHRSARTLIHTKHLGAVSLAVKGSALRLSAKPELSLDSGAAILISELWHDPSGCGRGGGVGGSGAGEDLQITLGASVNCPMSAYVVS